MRLFLGTSAVVAAASCCCGLGDDPGTSRPTPPAGETRFVVATPSLTLRASPSKEAAELADIPRAAAVVITGPSTGRDTAAGITGGWAPAWYGGHEGYVFDGFVFPWHPPPPGCAGLEAWAASLEHVGADAKTESPQCSVPDQEVECSRDTRATLTGGAWMHQNVGWEWGSETLHFPGVSREAVWAAARGCFASEPDLHLLALPTTAGPVPSLATDFGPASAVVEPGKAGWEWGDGCSGYVYVVTVGADTEIVSGGGC